MKQQLFYTFVILALFQSCTTTNYLKNCESILLPTKDGEITKFSYSEQLNELGHNSEPWEATTYNGKGDFWVSKNTFLRQDTLTSSRGRKYNSKTNYRNNTLLYLDYGDSELLAFTEDEYFKKLINTARYSPIILLNYLIENVDKTAIKTSKSNAIHSIKIGKFNVQFHLNLNNNTVDKITYLSYDELYGDVTTSFIYWAYQQTESFSYPTKIRIEKINGKVIDEVEIISNETINNVIPLLEKPADYKLVERVPEDKPEITTNKYNDDIYFIDLHHTNDKVMVVEFEDYLLVAEAPLNSKNGELIISEAHKIAPNKPIKYFAFGHHHPHYLGGLRAFVHNESTIICTDVSKDYVKYIAKAPHTLQPDKLQLEPKILKTFILSDSLTLGENNEMIIYSIGDKSAHTKDYLLYYFPKEKLLFQDDLCWIAKEGPIKKASARQAGLYNSIIDLNLEVETIIQSWPLNSHSVKTTFPFSNLEKSILSFE